jgi:hypothetical protein
MDSRDSSNPNRVRFFTVNTLVEHIAKKKWDLVKESSAQPFNQHVKFDLVFITLHHNRKRMTVLKNQRNWFQIPPIRPWHLGSSDCAVIPTTTPRLASNMIHFQWKASRLSFQQQK